MLQRFNSFVRFTQSFRLFCKSLIKRINPLEVLLVITLTWLLVLSLFWGYGIGRHQAHSEFVSVVTIDLNKILRAETLLASRVVSLPQGQNQESQQQWLSLLAESNAHLKAAIQAVAGPDRAVVIAAALLQGGEDITDRVLVKMGLPTKVPDTLPAVSALFPAAAHDAERNMKLNASVEGNNTAEDMAWLQP